MMRYLRSIRLVLLGAIVVFMALGPDGASASSIGVYFAPDASDCDAIVTAPFQQLNWYVLAVLNGGDAVASGITGGAMRVTGAPASWFHVVNQGPSIPEPPFGNLLQDGVDVNTSTCQTGTNGVVVLLSVLSLPTSVINNVVLTVAAPQMPNYAGYDSPVLFACDASFTHVCVRGTSGFINGPPCQADVTVAGGVCPPVAVAPNTWGAVKTLYGE